MDNRIIMGRGRGQGVFRKQDSGTEWEYTTTESERSSGAGRGKKKIEVSVEVSEPVITITRRGVANLVLEPAGTFQDNLPKNKNRLPTSCSKNKNIRSPFGLFMKEQAEILKGQGITIPNGFKGMADHLTPQWNAMSETEKSYWQAKSENVKAGNVSGITSVAPTPFTAPRNEPSLLIDIQKSVQKGPMGVTTFDNPIIPNDVAVLMELEEYITVRAKVEEFFATPGQKVRAITEKKMIILDITPYCVDMDGSGNILPAEWAASQFSIKGGVIKTFTGMINPGYIPLGAASEIRDSVITCGLPPIEILPEEAIEKDGEVGLNCSSVLQNIEDLIGNVEEKNKCVFVMRDNVDVVRKCLDWMSKISGKLVKYEIIPLSVVVELLTSWNPVGANFQLNEVESDRLLKKITFAYEQTISCSWHITEDNCNLMDKCAKNGAQRTMYNFLDYMCPLYDVNMRVPEHSPVLTQDFFLLRQMQRVKKENAVETAPLNVYSLATTSSKYSHSLKEKKTLDSVSSTLN